MSVKAMIFKPLLPRYWLVVLAAIGIALSTASCTSKVSSQPHAESNFSTTPVKKASTSASQGIKILSYEDVAPCDLLPITEAEEIVGRLTNKPTPERIGTARTCHFAPMEGSSTVWVRTNVGIAELNPNGGEIIDISINGRKARQLQDSSGTCGIALDGGSSARVDVTFYLSLEEQACSMALKVATAVEKNLTKLGL